MERRAGLVLAHRFIRSFFIRLYLLPADPVRLIHHKGF
ncbi:DUF1656 domain-containing protein [Acetobacter orientalis]|uniref:DUF1656 domain-containing protein n=1 Tax=Acetobacter orientalis TaxID=146474 RepID=A0A2Z5ZGW8_9PROT|nr:DUF1656 domain-containing protein [Acetobacter orientalis]